MKGYLRSNTGFSLVEVVIALGLLAFAITAILATLPIGLSTMREAREDTLQATLIRKLTSELSRTPFSDIVGDTLYFDGEGGQTNASSALYRLEFTVQAANTTSYPGAGTSVPNHLLTVQADLYREGVGSTAPPVASFPISLAKGDGYKP